MSDAADPLVLDFVEWIARAPRYYAEVVAIWRTSCPRLTIWEDASDRGYVARETIAGTGLMVTVTASGENCCGNTAASARREARDPRPAAIITFLRYAASPH